MYLGILILLLITIFLIKSLMASGILLVVSFRQLKDEVCPLITRISLVIHVIELIAFFAWLYLADKLDIDTATRHFVWYAFAAVFVVAMFLSVISFIKFQKNLWAQKLLTLDISIVIGIICLFAIAFALHQLWLSTCGNCAGMP